MKVDELINFGINPQVIDIWKKAGYEKLLPVQKKAIESGVLNQKSLLILAPTSSGKTFVGELAAIASAYLGKRTLYLVPLKALAEEKYLDFQEKYRKDLNIKISNHDHREYDDDIRIGKYDIAILTYEKLSSLLTLDNTILNKCDCLIVDELQMIMDPDRGGGLELLLTKIKVLKANTQIICLSAVLDNLNGFDKWLDLEVINYKDRPVELHEGILSLNEGIYKYREWNTGKVFQEHVNTSELNDFIENLIKNDEQVIIIRNTIEKVQEEASLLSNHFTQLPAATMTIKNLNQEYETETRDLLLKVLRNSIAFHHSELEIGERRIIENGFRNGEIKIIVSTTTLSVGVNLPCTTIILKETSFWKIVHGRWNSEDWPVHTVRNLLGRAGRLNSVHDFGRGIIVANDAMENRQLWNKYIMAPLEDLHSTFERKNIALRVLDVVATGFGGNEEEIKSFIFQTFAAQAWQSDIAKEQINNHISIGIQKCLEYKLLIKDDYGIIRATDLGRVCASKGCDIDTFIHLVSSLNELDTFDTITLCYIASGTNEVLLRYYRNVNWNNQERRNFIINYFNNLHQNNKLSDSFYEFYCNILNSLTESRIKQLSITLLIYDLLETNDKIRTIIKKHTLTNATVKKVCEDIEWMFDIMGGIAETFDPILAEKIQIYTNCISNRSPLSCQYLNRLKFLNRDEFINLVTAGFISEDDFVDKIPTDFHGIINPSKANSIIETINNNRTKDYEFWLHEHKRRLDLKGSNTIIIENLYKSTGINLERAIEELFDTGFTKCTATRITDQHEGEPDLLMIFPNSDKLTVQITAKEDNTKFVDSKKAGDVIAQSARFHPQGFICIGRPDFQKLAIEHASHLAKDFNFKLIPVYVLAELYVRFVEGKLTLDNCTNFLLNTKGYIQIKDIDMY